VDPNLALIVGALIGALAGVGGAWLTNRANSSEQAKEREHARQLERERWEREDRYRFVADVRQLYASVLREADRVVDGIEHLWPLIYMAAEHGDEGPDLDEAPDIVPFYVAVNALEFLGGPRAVTASRKLVGAVIEVHAHHLDVVDFPKMPDEEHYLNACAEFRDARSAFVAAVREELGVEPLPENAGQLAT
jgi:hypothetical protein